MADKNKNQGENLFKAVIMTHMILFLHLLIIVGLVLMVIFLRGITQNMLGVFLGATCILTLSGLLIYRRIKSKGKKIFDDIEKSSLFQGRSFEVSFLRGLASLKFNQPDRLGANENPTPEKKFQLEDPETARIRELTELGR